MPDGTIICDLDGVVYLGDEEVPGAGAALRHLEHDGYRLLFATNNSWRTRRSGADKIRRVTGYPARVEQFVSSATAAAALLRNSAGTALVVGGPGIEEAVVDIGLELVTGREHVDVVVVGLDRAIDYERLSAATTAILAGARFVATNDDVTFPSPDGLKPGAGAIVAALEATTGLTAERAGKPHSPMRALLTDLAGPGSVVMVGDRPETDLAMAAAEGWTSVLVLTGVVSDSSGVSPAPDLVIGSIADLPDALEAIGSHR